MTIKHPGIYLFLTLALILSGMLSFLSCTHEPVFSDNLDTVCFEKQVLPVLQNRCGIAGCHNPGGFVEGFSATDYNSISRSVTPGDVHASRLYKVITDIWGETMMPPDRPLTLEQRTIIHLWIAQGALNTACNQSPPDTTGNGNTGGNTISSDSICFLQDILPIFTSSCASEYCHSASSHVEGYTLTNYTTITQKSGSIVPFLPNQSKLYKVITENEIENRMPPYPDPPLDALKIKNLQKWIEQGALNSDCPELSCDTLGIISFKDQVNPVIQLNCVTCHNLQHTNGGVRLDNYQQVKLISENQRSGISILIGSIKYMTGFAQMPQSSRLDDCTIRKIELWINQGIKDN